MHMQASFEPTRPPRALGADVLNISSGNLGVIKPPSTIMSFGIRRTRSISEELTGFGFGLIKAGSSVFIPSRNDTATKRTACHARETLMSNTIQADNRRFIADGMNHDP